MQARFARQRGVALILVLVIVAFAGVLSANLLQQQQRLISLAAEQTAADQAFLYAVSLEQWAMRLLRTDRAGNASDSEQDIWATAFPAISVAGGEISARITDYQARLNLNRVFRSGAVDQAAKAALERLFQSKGMDPAVTEALVDWIDKDHNATGYRGAEDDYYTRLPQAYLSAGRELADVSELRLVRGMSERGFLSLSPVVAALPASAGLNVNTASPEVLAALGTGPQTLQRILAERRVRPFESLADFEARVPFPDDDPGLDGLDVSSGYFLLHAEVVLGGYRYVQETLIQRADDGSCSIRWRQRRPGGDNTG